MSVSGSVYLLSDTSLVRIIISDQEGVEFMAFEAYPLIVGDSAFSIFEECDETCYLNACSPFSLEIQIIDASLLLDSLTVNYSYQDNLDSLMMESKRLNDSLKILQVNSNIQQNNMIWVAGSNSLSELNYHDKRKIFGEKYNLLGLDYYMGGLFDPFPNDNPLTDNSNLIKHYDWRQRHDADSNTSFYYDNDPDHFYKPCQNLNIHETGNGWMTGIRDQDPCSNYCKGTCYIFAPLAAFEGLANIYFNHHIDYDLSEQHVLDCDSNDEEDQCEGGYPRQTAIFAKTFGVVDEDSYPWLGNYSDECPGDPPVPYPEYQVKIRNWQYVNPADIQNIKSHLVDYGPMCVTINYAYSYHAMALVGFGEVSEESLLHNFSGWELEDISEYLGQTYWIFKNSYTPNWGEGGYMYHAHTQFGLQDFTYYPVPIDDIWSEEDTIRYRDADKDGYWNWGIVDEPPESLTTLCGPDPIKDWNDNNNRIGNCDENYHGLPVMPQIKVYCHREMMAAVYVDSNSFFPVYDNDPLAVNGTYTFRIENPGNAQLNLAVLQPVTTSNPANFQLDVSQLETRICMDNGFTEFYVTFDDLGSTDPLMTVISISLDPYDHDVAEHFEFAMIHDACANLGTTNAITSNEIWSGFHYSQENIHIQPGVTLTLEGTLGMAEDCRITVDRGAYLKIDGGKITSLCSKLWEGIDLWGDGGQPQISPYQGRVTVTNGGTIEYAIRGIETARYDGLFYYQSGGIVYCNGANFKDNLTGIYFHRYQNHNTAGDPLPNVSRIRNTVFKTTDQLGGLDYNPALTPVDAIHMNNVDGTIISGTTFGNFSDDPSADRGTGIFSMNGGYYLECKCATSGQNPCSEYLLNTFENLRYGVRAFTDGSQNTITIDSVAFKDNYRGVFMSGLYDARILRSTFDLTDADDIHPNADPIAGISLEYSQRYQVEENVIFSDADADEQKRAGMQVLNSGPVYNEVYKNSFGYLDAGIVAAGENRDEAGLGLCLICNDFTECVSDIYVTDQGGSIQPNLGIALWQGEDNGAPDGPASNIFSNFQGIHYNIENISTNLFYYVHHDDEELDEKLRPEPVNDEEMVRRIEDESSVYSENNSCPSRIHGNPPEIQMELTTMENQAFLINSYEDSLNLVVDGGDTEALSLEVNNSTPDETLILRQQLMDESPYLSDTVMKSAIMKEDVLPNIFIRDILVANPQSAKSPGVIQVLETKSDTMPGYMKDEILQGVHFIGQKEVLEAELVKHKSIRFRSLNKVLSLYKYDTTNITSTDSAINLLRNENNFLINLQSSHYALDVGDSSKALSILDSISINYILAPDDQLIIDAESQLIDLKINIRFDTISSLDSNTQIILWQLYDSYNYPTTLFVRNILKDAGYISFSDSIYLPDNLKTLQVDSPQSTQIPPDLHHLKIFPNPARKYFICEYQLPPHATNSYLSVSNLSGILIMESKLDNEQYQFVVPTELLAAGIYLVQLNIDGTVIESKKIEIVK